MQFYEFVFSLILILAYLIIKRCSNQKKQEMEDVLININLNQAAADSKTEKYTVELQGSKQLFIVKKDLENGFEPFKDISITKVLDMDDDDTNNQNDDQQDDDTNNTEENIDSQSAESDSLPDALSKSSLKLSKCVVKLTPERNLMRPTQNNEKIMFLQNLLDEFSFKFEETLTQVTISGEQSHENYETFIRHLTYIIVNINEINDPETLKLIEQKKFKIMCMRQDTQTWTNSIEIKVNLTKEAPAEAVPQAAALNADVAMKQSQKFVVSENDDDIISQRADDINLGRAPTVDSSSNNSNFIGIHSFFLH
jgi:hypothetical protein